jgi:hypothetical protein
MQRENLEFARKMNDFIRLASPASREPFKFKDETLRTETRFIKLKKPTYRESNE